MRSRSSSFCLALFLFIRSIASQTCSTTRSANCCENNSTNQADTSVSFESQTAVRCCFEGNLCRYRQGCVDSGMGNWNATNGYASVSQRIPGSGINVYSVLESPWVNVSTPSCIEFTYSRGRPYQLQVFLALHNVEQPCLVENSNDVADNTSHTARFSITPMTGKIQFRVLGGGAGFDTPPPKLYHVAILGGGCVHQASPSEPRHTSNQCKDVLDTSTSSSSSVGARTSPASPTEPRHTSNQCKDVLDTSTSSSSSVGARTSPGLSTGTTALDVDDSANSAATIAVVIVIVVVVLIVVIIGIIVYRRKRHRRRGSGSDGARQLAVYENQGFHGQPVGTPVDDSSVVNARDMSDHRDPSRASDASNEYLTQMNVYDGLGNRNIEENPYNALANQNSTYEGLSPNRNETRLYDSLVASGGQSEDYEIPDTTGLNKEGVTEVNRDSDEYYNQASSKMTGNSSLSQDVPSSEVSEYQSG